MGILLRVRGPVQKIWTLRVLLVWGLLLCTVAIPLALTATAAASSSWQAASSHGSWSDGDNWDGGIPNDSAAVAEFPSYASAPFEANVDIDAAYSVGSLIFTSTSDPGDYSLVCDGAGTLSLYSSVVSSGSTGAIIQCPVTLMGNVTVSGTSAGLYAYRALSGTGGITIDAHPGFRLYTTDAATYSGPTYINNGALQAGYDNTFSPNSDYILADSANALLQIGGPVPETIGSLSGGAASTVDLWGGTLTVGNANDTTYAGTITNGIGEPSNLIKQGSGKLTLSGNNTYTGTTTVAEGILAVNGTLASSGVTVQPGATLRGSGALPAVSLQGIVAPGNSIGTLSGTDFTFANGSTLENELNADGQTDRIEASGSVTINSGATLKIIPVTGSYKAGQTYTILNAPSITGTFSSVIDTSGSLQYEVRYYATHIDIVIKDNGNVSSSLADTGQSTQQLLFIGCALILIGGLGTRYGLHKLY